MLKKVGQLKFVYVKVFYKIIVVIIASYMIWETMPFL